MWKASFERFRAAMTGERLKKIGWYGALTALLVILGTASHAYRSRYSAVKAAPTTPPVAAMAVATPKPLEALFSLPSPTPEPTPEPLVFSWPVDGDVIGEYAPEALTWSDTMNQWQTHPGIDIAASAGEVVTACADGTVRDAWEDPMWGNVVEIEHREGYVSTYANLNTLNMVNPGEEVAAGQIIGAVGNTADCESEMPWHLHFALSKDDVPVDFVKTVQQ